MRRVKYIGYCGNATDHVENEGMGLVPGMIYDVVGTTRCCDVDDDPSEACTAEFPNVINKRGEVMMLVHDEFEALDEIERCTCDFNSVILITGCVCGGK